MTAEAPGDRKFVLAPGSVFNLAMVSGDHNTQINYFITKDSSDPVERLAGLVWEQWSHEAELRDLLPVPIPVLWRVADHKELGDHPELTGAPAEGSTPDLASFTESFSEQESQRLVILGEAGSGKTTLAVLLVLELLRQRQEGGRVPVLLSLSSWRPSEEHPTTWLKRQLTDEYPFLSDREAHRLLNRKIILPVLDGLDELPAAERPMALKSLNSAYLATDSMALTCRTRDYTEAIRKKRVLRSATVVMGQPLTAEAVAGHLLKSATPQHEDLWQPLADAVEQDEDGPAAKALSVPLLLWLCSKVYQDADQEGSPGDLMDFPTVEEIERHLLDSLVPSVYPSRPRPPVHPDRKAPRRWSKEHGPREAERAARWLGHLARHLETLKQTDLRWWALGTTLRPSTRMAVTGGVSGVCVGAVVFLVDSVYFTVYPSRPFGDFRARFAEGLLVGLVDALVNGLPAGLLFALAHRIRLAFTGAALEPSRMRVRLRGRSKASGTRSVREILRRVRTGLVAGFAGGAGIGIMLGLWALGSGAPLWYKGGLVTALMFGAQFAVAFGLVIGVLSWLEVPVDTESAVRPRGLLAANRNTVLVQLLLFGPVAGVAATIGFTPVIELLGGSLWDVPLRTSPVWDIRVGLLTAFAGGLGAALSLTAWGEWVVIARIWLPLTGRLPWRAMTFLEDAHRERGVLRQAGAVYQFRHARLREHLAGPPETGAEDRSRHG
ncbi:NACHT domain-containing protein [Kitasatospora sp. NPDC056783]|uniref:NACHT domain-containing protein n=1 Tax=Kitasatospora sp. NPDC056783 TaxID=3345943 RepID=UPI0036C9A401